MARAGAAVVVNDLGVSLSGAAAESSVAHEVAEEILAVGGRAIANGDSVASWDGAQRMVQAAIEALGRIDVVVDNAGNLRDSLVDAPAAPTAHAGCDGPRDRRRHGGGS